MSKVFRPYEPRQGYLLPPSPLEWLPEGHLAYFLLDVVGELDLSSIYAPYEREEVRQVAFRQPLQRRRRQQIALPRLVRAEHLAHARPSYCGGGTCRPNSRLYAPRRPKEDWRMVTPTGS